MLPALPLGCASKEGKVWQDASDGGALEAVPHARSTAVDEVLSCNRYELLVDLYHQAACPAPPSRINPQAL